MYLIAEVFFLLNNCGRLVSISLDRDEIESYINNHLVQGLIGLLPKIVCQEDFSCLRENDDRKFTVKNHDTFNH